MWDFFSKVAGALPPWFLMALIVALLAAAAWTLPRLRRDKNGRLYIYSRSYEHQKNRAKEQRRDIQNLFTAFKDAGVKTDESLSRIEARIRSLECEDLKQSFYLELIPSDERLIAGLKYVYSGGNGSVREDVARFVQQNPDVYKDVITRFPQWALPQGG